MQTQLSVVVLNHFNSLMFWILSVFLSGSYVSGIRCSPNEIICYLTVRSPKHSNCFYDGNRMLFSL